MRLSSVRVMMVVAGGIGWFATLPPVAIAEAPSVPGVEIGDTEAAVRAALGEPTGAMAMEGRKTLVYPGFSVILADGRVERFMGLSGKDSVRAREAGGGGSGRPVSSSSVEREDSGKPGDIRALMEEIETTRGLARAHAVERCVGEWATPAVPLLVSLLEDSTPFRVVNFLNGMNVGTGGTTMGQIAADSLSTIGLAAWEPCMVQLASGSAFARANAAVTLSRLRMNFQAGDTAFPARLVEVFNSPVMDVGPAYSEKTRMVSIVEQLDTPEALEALHRAATHEYPFLAGTVMEMLGRKHLLASIPVLAEVFLHSADEYRRGKAGDALRAYGHVAAGHAVREGAGHADAKVRQTVAEILGQSKEDVFVPTLLELLKDRDEGVRRMAVRSLGRIQSAASTLPLIAVVLTDAYDYAAQDAFHILSGLVQTNRDPAVVGALRPGLEVPDARRRAWAAELVGRTRAAEAYEELAGVALTDPDETVRRNAVQFLDGFDDPRRGEVLKRCLADPSGPVRQAAMQAVKYGSLRESQREILLEILRKGHGERAQEAVFALADLHLVERDPGALSVLIRLLSKEDPQIRGRAEDILCQEAGIPRYSAKGKELGGNPDRWKEWWRGQGILMR